MWQVFARIAGGACSTSFIVFAGNLHWLYNLEMSFRFQILVFDTRTEEFATMDAPPS